MKEYKTTHYNGCNNMTDSEIEKLNELLQGKIDYFQSRLTKWYEENDVEVYMSYYSSMTSLADGFHNILDYSSIDDDAHKDYWSEVFDIDGALDIVFDVLNKLETKQQNLCEKWCLLADKLNNYEEKFIVRKPTMGVM